MALHPPDYLTVPSGDGTSPASISLVNPLLRPLDGGEFTAAILKYQEPTAFVRCSQHGKMVGQVLGMCPPREIRQKVETNIASDLERTSTFKVNPKLAMKSFQRSDASRVFKPEEIRPAVWCRRSVYNILCYFVDADQVKKTYLLEKTFTFLDIYNFLRDRLRSIWQDLTVQQCTKHRGYIECFEISIRFLIYSNEILCENEEYDIAQNMGLLNTCLDKLMQGYEDASKYGTADIIKQQGIYFLRQRPYFDDVMGVLVYDSPHEAEFWSYRLLMHIPQLLMPGGSATFCDIRQRMPARVRTHKMVTFAIEVCHAAASGNTYHYFHLLRQKDCHALHAALMNRFAICLRVRFIDTLVSEKIVKKDVNPLDLYHFKKFLGYDGESSISMEKLCRRYNIGMSKGQYKVYMVLEECNEHQLEKDSKSLHKLYKKFQTTSMIVNSKFERFSSRQKLFDPDFEYPKGCGPDTIGPPLDDLSPPEIITPTIVAQKPTSARTYGSQASVYSAGSAGSSASESSTSQSQSQEASSEPVSSRSTGSRRKGKQRSRAISPSGTPIQTSEKPSYQIEVAQMADQPSFSLGEALFEAKMREIELDLEGEPKEDIPKALSLPLESPIELGEPEDTPILTIGAVVDEPKGKPSALLFGSEAEKEEEKSAQLHFETSPSRPIVDVAPLSLPAPTPAPAPAPAATPPPAPAPEKPKDLSPISFGSLKGADDKKGGTPFRFGAETPPVFTFGKPVQKEGPKKKPVQIDEGKKKVDDTPSIPEKPPVIVKKEPVYDFSGFTTRVKLEPLPAPPPVFTLPGATGATPIIPTVIVITDEPVKPVIKKREERNVFSLSSIIEKYEREKALRHIKLKKPKVLFKLRSIELDPHFPMPKSKNMLNKFRRIGTSIANNASKMDDDSQVKDKAFAFRVKGSILSKSCTLNEMLEYKISDEGVVVESERKPTDKMDVEESYDIMNKCEMTPREPAGQPVKNIVYLTKEGSLDFVSKMYQHHLEKKRLQQILPVFVDCEYCRSTLAEHTNRGGTILWNCITKYLSSAASSIYKCTSFTTNAISDMIKKRKVGKSAKGKSENKGNARGLSWSDTYETRKQIFDFTHGAVKRLASSTIDASIFTSIYLSKAFNTSKRILQDAVDEYQKSISEHSTFECFVKESMLNMGSIISASENRASIVSRNMLDIAGYEKWHVGLCWHLNFFDPVVERTELFNKTSSGSESSRRLTSVVLGQSIDDYMTSEYCVRLKQDVLHILGFHVSAEQLMPTYHNPRRHMVECMRTQIPLVGSTAGSKSTDIPLVVAISVNLYEGTLHEAPPTSTQDKGKVEEEEDYGAIKKKRKLSSSVMKMRGQMESILSHRRRVIQPGEPGYNAKQHINVYALSSPVTIAQEDVIQNLFQAMQGKKRKKISVSIQGVDSYGIISSVYRRNSVDGPLAYTPCIVCYRIGFTKSDFLAVYEFLNQESNIAVSLCGCLKKNREAVVALIEMLLESIEKRMMDDILLQAKQLKAVVDLQSLKRHIVFACVGFQLNVEGDISNIPYHLRPKARSTDNAPAVVPRLFYPEGLRTALHAAAKVAIEAESVFMLQKPFYIPNMYQFLSDLFDMCDKEYTNHPSSVPCALSEALDQVIAHVKREIDINHWDSIDDMRIARPAEEAENDEGCVILDYCKESFIQLLRRLKEATTTFKLAERRVGIFAVDEDEIPLRIHKCIHHVLSNVVIKESKVPYAVGLYITNVSRLTQS
ncbi:SAC3/GANP/THP3 domain containing protein [Babesia gibsoni]|uniref:SAC3/GANP/THP3 domain containing protein n=1 Tax=Babesia gibsoni TaxID=33632 RepID=A0AAD8PGI0_BABGI|nr:SAC3/GANP/THP3 domain containing protein [Babesia gibsoni]